SLAVNSAGVQLAKEFLSYSSDEFSWVVNVNLIGSRNFAAAVLPLMATGGRLALVASLAGLLTSYSYAAYNASKHGVVGLAGALRMDCIPLGVEVSVICPPEVETPMVEEERKTMHPIAKQQKEVAGSLSLEQAGEEILSALGRGKYMIIPGFRARWVWRISRWLPNTMATISSAMVRKFSDT
ncbi:MAG: SDR family NAD(P)-dependent oxidoreductase, partial [Cellvibrionaceae bacterium]|nr:SDR family NAD(P)-dependent oxidoreductase [Cellvibrionaceae bacterium]